MKSGVTAKIGGRFRREQNETDIECSAGADVSARTKLAIEQTAPDITDLSLTKSEEYCILKSNTGILNHR